MRCLAFLYCLVLRLIGHYNCRDDVCENACSDKQSTKRPKKTNEGRIYVKIFSNAAAYAAKLFICVGFIKLLFFHSCTFLSVDRLHCGEQKDVTDGCGVGKKHYESVYTEAETACGRQTVLKGGDIVVINLRLARGILRLSLCYLTLKAFSLVDGIVELGECVAEFGCVDELLETLGECGILGLSLCKRAILHGVIVDEGGLDEVFFNECIVELN